MSHSQKSISGLPDHSGFSISGPILIALVSQNPSHVRCILCFKSTKKSLSGLFHSDYQIVATTMNERKDIDLRAKYLFNASQHLLIASPASSAYIMAERLEMMAKTDAPLDQSKSPTICLVCGMKLLPGLTSRISTHSKRDAVKQTRDKQLGAGRKVMPLVTSWQEECFNCRRITRTELTKPTLLKRKSQSKQLAGQPRQTDLGHGTEPSTRIPNRKRKKNKGLLGKLKDEERRANSSPELNLMDFMKAV